MRRAQLLFNVTLIVFLTGCTAIAAPTATQPPPTSTATTAPTEPPVTPTPAAPTAEPPTPTPAGPCTDKASFVEDVTVPDYSHFDQRAGFVKTWRLKNVGTCTWTSDYQAKYSHGDSLGAALAVPLTETAPQATVDISVNMAAPARDGKFEIFYELDNAAGDTVPVDDGASFWALITVGKFIASAPPTPATSASGSTSGAGLATITCVTQGNASFLSQMVSLINAARSSNSLPALTLNTKLSTAAQSHSADMACNNFLRHIGWNGSTPDSRVAAAGYSASITRENIYGQPPQYGGTAQAAVDWWMSDAEHAAAILNPQVTEIGVGYAAYTRSDLGGYFTVDLAAP